MFTINIFLPLLSQRFYLFNMTSLQSICMLVKWNILFANRYLLKHKITIYSHFVNNPLDLSVGGW